MHLCPFQDTDVYQIFWLLVAFAWGIMRLMSLLKVTHKLFQEGFRVPENENSQWGFGQVVAVVLLAVPPITFIEAFGQGTVLLSIEMSQRSTSSSFEN